MVGCRPPFVSPTTSNAGALIPIETFLTVGDEVAIIFDQEVTLDDPLALACWSVFVTPPGTWQAPTEASTDLETLILRGWPSPGLPTFVRYSPPPRGIVSPTDIPPDPFTLPIPYF